MALSIKKFISGIKKFLKVQDLDCITIFSDSPELIDINYFILDL